MSLGISLPDGSIKNFSKPVTGLEIAKSIGEGLFKATVAARVDGKLYDACDLIFTDSKVELITLKDKDGLEIMRHTCAHLLGHALKQLYPSAKMAIGPVIENGFYYDIDLDKSLNNGDLEDIEKRMYELAKIGYTVIKKTLQRSEVKQLFKDRDEGYKLELVSDMPNEKEFNIYYHQEYIDMCRGPHLPHMKFIKAFKLTRVAGAYWRGKSSNKMLQRIYGVAFQDKKNLNTYLTQQQEAEKRDHRKLGKQLNLFHFEDIAPGMVFWHHKGYQIFQMVQNYIQSELHIREYSEVKTPLVLDKVLWQKSGHWEKFQDNMFITSTENRDYAVKPMNCPGHIEIYKQSLRSYRDLPIRIAEFGLVHRNEASGTLHGLMRVRSFTQDDGHIFCTEEQIETEVKNCIELIYHIYQHFGFDSILVKFSTRPEIRVGTNKIWDKAETALEKTLQDANLKYEIQEGEGAFYGPKIEFTLLDAIGRMWQCGTIQLDFSMPARLGASYIAKDQSKKVPVMIHRAILGSIERFVGILTEHYEGNFPFWLAPIQVVVTAINEKQHEYCRKIYKVLQGHNIRVNLDLRNEKIGYKIREHILQKIPYILVAGEKEVADSLVNVRFKEDGGSENLGSMTLNKFISLCLKK